MAKTYYASANWEDEEYSFFERIHSKNKARSLSEKAASASGRNKAKFMRGIARKDKEVRLGIPMPEVEPLVCGTPASSFFSNPDFDPEPYAA